MDFDSSTFQKGREDKRACILIYIRKNTQLNDFSNSFSWSILILTRSPLSLVFECKARLYSIINKSDCLIKLSRTLRMWRRYLYMLELPFFETGRFLANRGFFFINLLFSRTVDKYKSTEGYLNRLLHPLKYCKIWTQFLYNYTKALFPISFFGCVRYEFLDIW